MGITIAQYRRRAGGSGDKQNAWEDAGSIGEIEMEFDPIFLTLAEAFEIHKNQIGLYGGMEGMANGAGELSK